MMPNEKLFSITIKDFEIQTFRSGGKGGQNQNKRDTGVRLIHHPSGARAECREERSQLENKRRAFSKIVNSGKFKIWLNKEIIRREGEKSAEEKVAEQMVSTNIIVEIKDNDRWVETKEL